MSNKKHRKALVAGDTVGDYCIERCIGRGGASIAYRAKLKASSDDSLYIIKEIYPKALSDNLVRDEKSKTIALIDNSEINQALLGKFYESQRKEIRILKTLKNSSCENNPYFFNAHIIQHEGVEYSVIFTDGGKMLSEIMAERDADNKIVGLFSLADVLHFCKRILESVSPIHAKEYLHGDISPSNLYVLDLQQDGKQCKNTIKTIDFNNSFHINDMQSEDIFYNEDYSPVEYQSSSLGHKRNYSSDLYSVAAILFAILYNDPPDFYALDMLFSQGKNLTAPPSKKLLSSPYFTGENIEIISASISLLKMALVSRIKDCSSFTAAIDNILAMIAQPHKISNIFYPSDDVCIGREFEQSEIKLRFDSGNHIAILHGSGGIGKTAIAYEYAKNHRDAYGKIFKIKYSRSLINTIINRVDISSYTAKAPNQTNKSYYTAKLKKISSLVLPKSKRNLIIIDDMNNGLDANFSDLTLLNCDILITTRNKFSTDLRPINVDLIADMQKAIEIFRQYYTLKKSPEETEAEDVIIADIIGQIGTFPLILRLLACAIMQSGDTLEDIANMISNSKINYPSEKITYDKDGVPLTSSADEILEYIFDLSKIETADNINILRNMSLIPNDGISKSQFRKMLALKNLDTVNALIDISIIQEDTSTGRIYLHQAVSDMLRKKYKPNCQNCKKMLTYLTAISTAEEIVSLREYSELTNIFFFIESVLKGKNNKIFTYYSLQTAKLMTAFNDFSSAQRFFDEIIQRDYDEYSKYCAYQYNLAIALSLGQYTQSERIFSIIQSWKSFEEYDDIYIGVSDSQGWIYLSQNTEQSINSAIMLYQNILHKYRSVADIVIADKLQSMQYSLALSHYALARFSERDKNYDIAKNILIKIIDESSRLHKNEHLCFRYQNLLAECYSKMGEILLARDEHLGLISRKLKYHNKFSHTLLVSYRNLALVEFSIFQQDIEANFEGLSQSLRDLEEVSREFSQHDFLATAFDIWIGTFIKTREYDLLYAKLTDLSQLVADACQYSSFYKNNYIKYSRARLLDFIASLDTSTSAENKFTEIYNKLEASAN